MDAVRLCTVSDDHQVAVVTSKGLFGVCAKGQENLWALSSYDNALHDSEFQGLAFLPDNKKLVAWTKSTAISWTLDWERRTSTRISNSDFDEVTKELQQLLSSGVRVVSVKYTAENSGYIVSGTEELTLTTIATDYLERVSFPSSETEAISALVSGNTLVVQSLSDIRVCQIADKEKHWLTLYMYTHPSTAGVLAITNPGDVLRLNYVDGEVLRVRYGLDSTSVSGAASIENMSVSDICHIASSDRTITFVHTTGHVDVRRFAGMKNGSLSSWAINLNTVQTPEQAQAQIAIDAKQAEKEVKEAAEKEEAEKQEALAYNKERGLNMSSTFRHAFLGPTPHLGKVDDWYDVEPHMFRSAPAVAMGYTLDGGVLPPRDTDNSELLKEVKSLKEMVATLCAEVGALKREVRKTEL